MYFPLSQIKPNLYTNGGEYILSTTRKEYKGYYFETSNGKKLTGKTPQDGPNIILLNLSPTNDIPNNNSQYFNESITLNNSVEEGFNQYSFFDFSPYFKTNKFIPRSLPQFNPTIPTQQDINLGVFSRYFCKKNNELIYLEINQQTYTQLLNRDPKIAWDLYTPLATLWYIKGDKEKTYKANKGLISIIEQRQQWYGFSKYLKEDFLKYYSA